MHLQKQKTELETLRAQWRSHAAANPTDPAAPDALRQIESQLATVNAQLVHGPGARGVVNRDRGRATIAQNRNPSKPPAVVMPAPMATAQSAAARPSFVSETDVPYPIQTPSQGAQVVRRNGRAGVSKAGAFETPATPQPAAPAVQIETPATDPPRSYSFTSASDVPYPENKPLPVNGIFRSNGNR